MGTTDSSSLIAGCRVLLITTGSRGDVQPFLVLAHALAEAEACSVVAAPRHSDNLTACFGVELIGLDDSTLDLQDELVGAEPVHVARSLGRIRPLMRRQLDDLAEFAHGESGRADIIVSTQKTLGGVSVAERFKAPGLLVQPTPTGSPMSALRAPSAPVGMPRLLYRASWLLVGVAEASWQRMVTQWRPVCLGLKTSPIPFSRIIASWGILSAWGPRLLAAPPGWRSSQSPPGFWWSRNTRTLPPDVECFLAAGSPSVVIGFGSMRRDDPTRLVREVMDGLCRAGCRGTLSVG